MTGISIIIPMYNAEKYISDCLESIKKQTYKNFECIIVNDGSTDSSLNKALEVINDDSRFRIINKKNGGVSEARNTGISIASREFIIFIDSDDYLEEHMLERLYYKQKESDYDIVLCPIRYISKNGSNKTVGQLGFTCNSRDFFRIIISFGTSPYVGGNYNKLYKRQIILKNKIIFEKNEYFAEDLVFNIKYFAYIRNAAFVVGTEYNYRIGNPNSLSKKKVEITKDLKRIDYIFKKYCTINDFYGIQGYSYVYYDLVFNRLINAIQQKSMKVNEFQKRVFSTLLVFNDKMNSLKFNILKFFIKHHIVFLCYLYLYLNSFLIKHYSKIRYGK